MERQGAKPYVPLAIIDRSGRMDLDREEEDTAELFKEGQDYDPKKDDEAMERVIASESEKSDGESNSSEFRRFQQTNDVMRDREAEREKRKCRDEEAGKSFFSASENEEESESEEKVRAPVPDEFEFCNKGESVLSATSMRSHLGVGRHRGRNGGLTNSTKRARIEEP
jgi:hypothetical protein